MKSLGGRSPYEVVTGIRPKLPSSLVTQHFVEALTVDEYAQNLIRYLKDMYQRLMQRFQDARDQNEESAAGASSLELHPGDLVLKKLTPEQHANAAAVIIAATSR